MSKDLYFLAGMLFQNISYRIYKTDLEDMSDSFIIKADVPERFFDFKHWEVFSDGSIYNSKIGLKSAAVKKLTDLVISNLSLEFKDYDITYEHLTYGKLFSSAYFTFRFTKKLPVKEVTMKDIEDKFGCKIKIVGDR